MINTELQIALEALKVLNPTYDERQAFVERYAEIIKRKHALEATVTRTNKWQNGREIPVEKMGGVML